MRSDQHPRPKFISWEHQAKPSQFWREHIAKFGMPDRHRQRRIEVRTALVEDMWRAEERGVEEVVLHREYELGLVTYTHNRP